MTTKTARLFRPLKLSALTLTLLCALALPLAIDTPLLNQSDVALPLPKIEIAVKQSPQMSDTTIFSGGLLTHFDFGSEAFATKAKLLDGELSRQFDAGDELFEQLFVAQAVLPQDRVVLSQDMTVPPDAVPPISAGTSGLGPLANSPSCESCHVSDGRASPQAGFGLLLRLGAAGTDEPYNLLPHPTLGTQFNDLDGPGLTPEGRIDLVYEEIPGSYGDGEVYSLRKPTYRIIGTDGQPITDGVVLSPRVAPPVFGLCLVEAIDDATLIALADPDDANGDGISGKVNLVWNLETGRLDIGRFGWKSEQPTLLQQISAAAANDMGLTNPLFPEPLCDRSQTACQNQLPPSQPELSAAQMEELVVYMRYLAVPGRRQQAGAQVKQGEVLFTQMGCNGCHTPLLVTSSTVADALLRNQAIAPYSDFLLHDMGPELADNSPSLAAHSSEWRTPPLWGIGHTELVNGHTDFLHDGRARNLAEAILWHGGEAEMAKESFRLLSQSDRQALLAFLNSL